MSKYKITRDDEGNVRAHTLESGAAGAQEGVFVDVKLYANGCADVFCNEQTIHICDLEMFVATLGEIVSIAKERLGEKFFEEGIEP